jgi:hypothetical protein
VLIAILKKQPPYISLHIATDFIHHPFQENAFTASASDYERTIKYQRKPVEFIHFLTGQ